MFVSPSPAERANGGDLGPIALLFDALFFNALLLVLANVHIAGVFGARTACPGIPTIRSHSWPAYLRAAPLLWVAAGEESTNELILGELGAEALTASSLPLHSFPI
jgi:hypothetical protein